MFKYIWYVDDIIISSKVDFKDSVGNVLRILRLNGYDIVKEKIYYKIGKVVVMGIIVGNNYLNVFEEFYYKLDNEVRELLVVGLICYRERVILLRN